MKRLYIIAFLFVTITQASAQGTTLSWAIRAGSTGNDVVQTMVTDINGNIYVAGSFEGTVDFDPGAGVQNKISAGLKDAFIAKYNSSNVFQWVTTFGSSGIDEVLGMDLDGTFLYITGKYTGTVDFDPGAGVQNEISLGGTDVFVGYYNMSAGGVGTVNSMGSTGDDYGSGISVVTLGNGDEEVYVTGAFSNTIDLDPGAVTHSHISWGSYDAFVAKYDNVLNWVWSKGLGSTTSDVGRTILIEGSTVIAGGTYTGAFHYDEAAPANTFANGGLTDGFIETFNSTTGAWTFLTSLKSTGDDNVTSFHSDGTSLWVGGGFSATAVLSGLNTTSLSRTAAGLTDAYVGKYTLATMNLVSFNAIGGTGTDFCNWIIADATNIWVAGGFNLTADLDPGAGVSNVVSNGSADAFVGKYLLSTGEFVSAHAAGGTGNDQVTGMGFHTDGLITTGVFENTVDFDPTAATVPLTSAGLWDAFIAKYKSVVLATEPTASPGAITISGITGSGFSANFTAASPAPAGYLMIYKIGSAPVSNPDDGVTYNFNDVIGDAKAFVTWVGAPTVVDWSGAAPNTIYHLAVYSFNGSGTTTNYRIVSPSRNSVTTLSKAVDPGGAPSGFNVTATTPNSISVSFTAAVNATGYIAFATNDGEVETSPSDGIVYTVGTDVDDDRVVYIGAATSFTDTGLDVDTEYTYSIYSFNGSGTSINYSSTSLDGADFTDVSNDVTPPVIVNNTPTFAAPNTPVKVSLTVTDSESGVDFVAIAWSAINQPFSDENVDYLENSSGNTWEFTIPASSNKEAGVEYLIYAYDVAGNLNDSNDKLVQVVVAHPGDGLNIPYDSPGSAVTNYRIIAVPLELDSKTVKDVFEDDLGAFDPKKYRLFSYDGTANRALQASTALQIGKGYWLIASERATIDTGPGKTKDTGSGKPTTITMTKGWNQIGNPFNFDFPWTNVRNSTDNTALVLGELKVYTGAFASSTTLKKMTGGYVMAQNAGTATFPLYVAERLTPPVPVNFTQSLTSDTWRVNMTARSGSFENTFAGFGMHPSADEENDRFDDFTLPRFFDYLEVNFNKKFVGSAFTSDVVPTAPNHAWEFEIASNVESDAIELSWNKTFPSSDGLELVLWDVDQQRAVDMKSVANYSFVRGQSHTFRIYFGDADFVKAETRPDRPVFHLVSPVPAPGNINFAFSVPETAGITGTSLSVYDMMGHKVTTVVNQSLPGGYHEAVWNIEGGVKPAAGIYISVLKFGDITLQKRLIIK